MGQQTSKVMTRREFAAEIVLGFLIGTVLFVEGVLILAGVVTVAGWGEGTLVQRVLVGLLVTGLGLVMLAAVTAGLARGGTRSRKPESATSGARPGAPADDGYGYHEWALGLSPPEGRRDRPDHGCGVAEI
jgi:hypothetical protein